MRIKKINNCTECGIKPQFSETDGSPTELICLQCHKSSQVYGGWNMYNRIIKNWNSFNLQNKV